MQQTIRIFPDIHVHTPYRIDVEFGQTSKWQGGRLVVISAFCNAAQQAQQIFLTQ
jgi:hypothetical protein